MATQSTSPQVLKKLEKEITKEGKTEEDRVKHAMKELSSTEKAQAKAHKAVHKAEATLEKAHKKELEATKAVNKATHTHDIAVTNLHGAEQDIELRRREDVKLQKDLDAKKAQVQAVIKEQHVHNGREAKLSELHSTAPGASTGNKAGSGGTGAGAGIGGGQGVQGGPTPTTGPERGVGLGEVGAGRHAMDAGHPTGTGQAPFGGQGQGQGQGAGMQGMNGPGMGAQGMPGAAPGLGGQGMGSGQ